jgi:RND family efflux transporter MFP subunit
MTAMPVWPIRCSSSCAMTAVLLAVLCSVAGCGNKASSQDVGGKTSGQGQRKFAVRTTTVTTQLVNYEIETVGSLVEENLYKVPAQVSGIAQQVHFSEGDSVTTGQELCRIDYDRYRLIFEKARNAVAESEAAVNKAAADLADTERKTSSTIEMSRVDLELAQSEFRRTNKLTQAQFASTEERETDESKFKRAAVTFDDARAAAQTQVALFRAALNEKRAALDADRAALALAEKDLSNAIVPAPIAGVIQQRMVTDGQYLTPGTVVAIMVQTDPLRLRFTVPESKSAVLSSDMNVQFTVPAYPGRQFQARIYSVGATADAESREVTCWARVGNAGNELRPGYFAKVRIVVQSKADAIVIPLGSVVPTEAGTVCYVVRDGTAMRKRIQTGIQVTGDAIEILSGLEVGEQLATDGVNSLQDKVPVQVAGEKLPVAADKATTGSATKKPAGSAFVHPSSFSHARSGST